MIFQLSPITFKSIALTSLRWILGLVFIFSAYVKLFPIEPFEYNFVEQGLSNWALAPFIARAFISLEFVIGGLLLFSFYFKTTLKIAGFLLLFFCIYLIWQIIKEGNQGNCGCFGTAIKMTPLEAIIKNVFMLGLVLILFYFGTAFDYKKWKGLVLLPIVLGIAYPLYENPPSAFIINMANPETVNYKFQNELIGNPNYSQGAIDLMQGKHIVCFFSLTCPHCRRAAYKMHIIQKKLGKQASIVMLITGNKQDEALFFEESKAKTIPYQIFNSENYTKLSGYTVPMIAMVDQGMVIKKFDGENISESDIANFFSIK